MIVQPAAGVADDIAADGDVLDDDPRRFAVLVAGREQDRIALLRVAPHVLHQVAFDEHAPRVLQLEEVLDLPSLLSPGDRLGEMVPPEHDVLR